MKCGLTRLIQRALRRDRLRASVAGNVDGARVNRGCSWDAVWRECICRRDPFISSRARNAQMSDPHTLYKRVGDGRREGDDGWGGGFGKMVGGASSGGQGSGKWRQGGGVRTRRHLGVRRGGESTGWGPRWRVILCLDPDLRMYKSVMQSVRQCSTGGNRYEETHLARAPVSGRRALLMPTDPARSHPAMRRGIDPVSATSSCSP